MMNPTLSQQLFDLVLNGKFIPAMIKLLNNFLPFAVLAIFMLILLAMYIWTEDSLFPAILLIIYLAVANLPIIPAEIRQSMYPEVAKPVLFVLIALAIVPVIVNLFVRNRGY